MKSIAKLLIFFLIIVTLYSCNSQRPVHYSKTHSFGFHHQDHIYFLLDYEVWKRGGRFWFIMPFQLPKKVYFREICLYRYEPDLNELEKLGVFRDEFKQAIDVKYSKFAKDNGKIVFAFHAGYDAEINPLIDFYIWDTKTGMFVDTGIENPVRNNHPLYQQYFSDYQSPWHDNPGIINISKLKNEVLQHFTNEDYDLPEKL